MEEKDHKELQLLPAPLSLASSSNFPPRPSDSSLLTRRSPFSDALSEGPSLDLQLSISLRPIKPSPNRGFDNSRCDSHGETSGIETLKWQAAEQIRLAAIEKAYAERVRDLTRREMELAQSEFVRARNMWERAREEVDRVERLKERATRKIDSTCMEITCQSCRQRFRT